MESQMSNNEIRNEQVIQEKGLIAPRVTPQMITDVIVGAEYHVFPGTTTTVCCLKLRNGFTVIGESACASPENFNEELGRDMACEDARKKIWALEGYLLKQQLHETENSYPV
jgi:Phage protein (N4 Gp49/phage Sf6 gene 66) family